MPITASSTMKKTAAAMATAMPMRIALVMTCLVVSLRTVSSWTGACNASTRARRRWRGAVGRCGRSLPRVAEFEGWSGVEDAAAVDTAAELHEGGDGRHRDRDREDGLPPCGCAHRDAVGHGKRGGRREERHDFRPDGVGAADRGKRDEVSGDEHDTDRTGGALRVLGARRERAERPEHAWRRGRSRARTTPRPTRERRRGPWGMSAASVMVTATSATTAVRAIWPRPSRPIPVTLPASRLRRACERGALRRRARPSPPRRPRAPSRRRSRCS